MSQSKLAAFNSTRAFACKSAAVSSASKAISHADFTWGTSDLSLAAQATITAHTQAVVFTYDGSTPTATHGHVLPANGTVSIQGNTNIQALKFIRQSADATVSVTLEN